MVRRGGAGRRVAACVVAVVAVATVLVGGGHTVAGAETTASASVVDITGTVDWNDRRQEIDGFGASGAFLQAAAIQKLPPAQQTEVLDLLFSQTSGAGLSLVRNLLPIISPAPGVYNFGGDQDQIWLMREARNRGTTRFLSTVWSPPAWMKDNQKVCCGGQVNPLFYPLFADYLAEYVLQYKAQHGIDIYAVSPANEPDASTDYDSSRWNGAQLRDFTRYVKEVFAAKNVPARYVIPEASYWGEELAAETLDDPGFGPLGSTRDRVDIVAGHGYARETNPQPFTRARSYGKKVWETEMARLGMADDPSIVDGLDWAQRVHNFLTVAEVSLVNHWWLATEKVNTREALINLHTVGAGPFTYSTTKRLFAMGNYSRFVRPGWVRMGASSGGSQVSAFRDPATGRFAVVAVNASTSPRVERLQMNGFTAASVVPHTTSATQDLAAGAPLPTTGGVLDATLPARSITTFVGDGVQTSPLAVSMTAGKMWSGESGAATVLVRNTGGTAVDAAVEVVTAGSVSLSPPSAVVSLASGQQAMVPVTVGAGRGVDGTFAIQAHVSVGGVPAVIGQAHVLVVDDGVAFVPNTAAEKPWLSDAGASQLDGAVADGNARFTDGNATATYRFDLPADVSGGTLALDIGNQFRVSTSTDGLVWTDRQVEAAPVRDLSNRAVRTLDLNLVRAGARTVYVRIGDSQPADGWGAWLAGIDLDVTRQASLFGLSRR